MKIFADEFIFWLKKPICKIIGHKESDWMELQWAFGHGTGEEVKVCLRCNKELNRKGLDYMSQLNEIKGLDNDLDEYLSGGLG